MELIEVTPLDAPAGDPMELVRNSRCLYGCGRSPITTGTSTLAGREVEVHMTCDSCDGVWNEFYRIPEVTGA